MDPESQSHPVVLFDGVCNLCEGFVQFVIRNDPEAVFRFAPLQSEVGQALLADCGWEDHELDGVVLVEDDACYRKSDAVLRVARRIGWPYRLLWATRFIPRVFRDLVYDGVAASRYRIFGQKEACLVPTPDIQERFLAGTPGPTSE